MFNLDLTPLAPLLPSEKELTKKELIEHLRPRLNAKSDGFAKIFQLLNMFDFFRVIKDHKGQVIVT
jgi:hypothetical protein